VIHRIFIGPDGVRPVWRLLIAIALYEFLVATIEFAVASSSGVLAWVRSQPRDMITPGKLLFNEGIRLGAALMAGLAMSRVEGRTFADYGFPPRLAFGKRFWQGAAYGLAMLALVLALMGAFGGFSIVAIALGGGAALRYGLLYALAFLTVALFEECTFRGYMQATLAQSIGFWPAAVVLSIWFGGIHLRNTGETIPGALSVACFAMVAAYSLRRTGNLWFAIGMHAAWDWGETFLCGVPDSGVTARGHLAASILHGPRWLTGGTTGPEASLLTFAVLAMAAAALRYLFPPKRHAA